MTDNETPPSRGGRPVGSTTGTTKLRTLRMGPIWERAEGLALELARRNDKVLRRTDRATGEVREFGNVTAYVEEALRRENARVEKLLARDTD